MSATPLEKVLAAIGEDNYRRSGKSFTSRCPAHQDRSPSLSISETEDGTVLVKCHSGCTTEEVVRALGLEMRDLFHRVDAETTPPRNPGKKGRGSATDKRFSTAAEAVADLEKRFGKRSATWIYRDSSEEPVGVIVRWEKDGGGKIIRPVAKTEGGWVQGGMPTPRPLYRLPELLESIGLVYVTEGEKAADAMHDLGFTVTTSAHGAKSAKGTDWRSLTGREIVILPDNDDAGAGYARDVIDLLTKLAPKPNVAIVKLPDLPAGGDAVDFIAGRRKAGRDDAAIRAEIHDLTSAALKLSTSPISIPPPQPPQTSGARVTTLSQATLDFLESIQNNKSSLISFGLPDLDFALDGGIDKGEMAIFAARPGHGKSAVAEQFIHEWTARGIPCAFVSEEMSARALGKRALQWISPAEQQHWPGIIEHLEADIKQYSASRAPCYIIENCRTVKKAAAEIERHIKEHGVQCVVVDYAQLLTGEGKDRYQQVTDVSITLRKLTSAHKIVMLALCQMNRSIEGRGEQFKPRMSDLKDSGQFDQDADIIVFLCWPCRLDSAEPKEKFQFFVQKNRAREIKKFAFECRFLASRQMFLPSEESEQPPPFSSRWQQRSDSPGEDY